MKILFAGGGTGGHFYPIISVMRSLREAAEAERIVKMEILFMSDKPFDEEVLRREGARFLKVGTGKMRRYFSFLNITDAFKTGLGLLKAFLKIYYEMPDVIVGKGGYASFPALFAARVLRIPVIIHESDAVPGRVNKWAASFARRIAISFSEAARFFPPSKVAFTGNPIRKQILKGNRQEALELFDLEKNIPTLLVYGGSQGSENINNVVLEALADLANFYQVIHQCGINNFKECKSRASVILEQSPFKNRYHPFAFLNEDTLKNAYKAADLVISRAGASNIFEIAAEGLASIIIPIKNSAQDHQRENAYAYAAAGASVIIEEDNLTAHVFLSEIKKIFEDSARMSEMKKAALSFAKVDAADKIAREIIILALEHAG